MTISPRSNPAFARKIGKRIVILRGLAVTSLLCLGALGILLGRGSWIWLGLFGSASAILMILGSASRFIQRSMWGTSRSRWVGDGLLTLGTLTVVIVGFELYLDLQIVTLDPNPPSLSVPPASNDAGLIRPPAELIEAAARRMQFLTIPDDWKATPIEFPGAVDALKWHGVLHVYNENKMRWATGFPERRPDVFRVMVVGDSITYGWGIAEDATFVSLLNKWVGSDFRVEFLNLGVPGDQSEDVLRVVKTFLPILRPNLVLYAVCENDFLPSRQNQYFYYDSYAFPLPSAVKNFLIQRTRVGVFLNSSYDTILRKLHLRRDYFDDILRDFDNYRTRFARDIKEMNEVVRSFGLPPLVGMVVDQLPYYGGRGHRIAHAAEVYLRDAGAEVISTEDYYRQYHNQFMIISRFEGHPNEVAHYIWAGMISSALRDREDLQSYRRLNSSSIDYQDAPKEGVRGRAGGIPPKTWKSFGKASYKTRADTVLMRGPDQIFTEVECGAARCEVEFSIDVQVADAASIGLYFFSDDGKIISEKTELISGIGGKATVKSETPELCKKVRAFVYSAREEDLVEFNQARLLVEPKE